MKEKVSIIICAYNEEENIEYVVRKCKEFNHESELLVIDDGSTDDTELILRNLEDELKFRYIRMPENKGKSHAMVMGVENATNEIILFWDADVKGIRNEHFDKLIDPFYDEENPVDMVMGSPSETLIDYRVNPFKSLTGERAIRKKELEPILENIRDIQFGVETYINLYFQAHVKKVKYTLLEGLVHPTKYGKTTPVQATQELASETKEIAVTLLQNYDLITKRIGNSFEEQGYKIKDSFQKLQRDINDKIHVLLNNHG